MTLRCEIDPEKNPNRMILVMFFSVYNLYSSKKKLKWVWKEKVQHCKLLNEINHW